MPRFAANAHIAAMSQRAAQVLRQNSRAAFPSGQTVQIPGAPTGPAQSPTTFLQNRVNQLAGVARMAANQVQALQINPYRAMSRDQIYGMAQQAAAARPNLGFESQADFEYHGNQTGLSGEQVLAAARRSGFGDPHQIMQEGHVEYRNGIPGVWIKYNTPQGSSTEWTPVG